MASQIERAVQRHRAALRRRERETVATLVELYQQSWRRLRDEHRQIARELTAMRDAGESIDPQWIRRQTRVQSLMQQIENEVTRFSRFAERRITQDQIWAVQQARGDAEQLMMQAFGRIPPEVNVTFGTIPSETLEAMVGRLSDGSPLRELFDELPMNTSQRAEQALIDGLIQGQSPRKIASNMRSAFGGDLGRSLLVARTETLNAYRMASLETYKVNDHLLEGWTWIAALDTRTCLTCWILHGQVFSTNEAPGNHPGCRCGLVPKTRSWADLGYPDIEETRPVIDPGIEQFARLDADDQMSILGPSRYRAWQDGAIDLRESIVRVPDDKWGPTWKPRSLRSMVGTEQAQKYMRVA